MKNIGAVLVAGLLFLLSFRVEATHLRAAEITAKRLSPTTYQITLVLFADWENVADNQNAIVPNDMQFQIVNIQGQNFQVERSFSEVFGSDTYRTLMSSYVFNYNFSAVGSSYTISFVENFRNGGIANINDGNSKEVPLHVSFELKPAVSDDENTSPVLLIPPIDEGAVGRPYIHNPGAYDPDGDSLSYRLVTPTEGVGSPVLNYRFPDDPYYGEGSEISIDPVTGDLVWDSPKQTGIYNVAIEVTEWGTSPLGAYLKSRIVRDMQINVVDSDNEPPVIVAPPDTCVEAGKPFSVFFSGYDPNGDELSQEKYGGILQEGAKFDFARFNSTKDTLYEIKFEWEPTCSQVQKEPHAVTFKLTDDYAINLSDLHTYQINVNLPAPVLLSVQEVDDSLELQWESYFCQSSIDLIDIWRIECDTNAVFQSSCTQGVPLSWGATKIGTVDPSSTSFKDGDVVVGQNYCYILVARPTRGEESVASNIECGSLDLDEPLISRVSILETNSENGKTEVDWIPPTTLALQGPVTTEVFRSSADQAPKLVYLETNPSLQGGTFIDSLINNADTLYQYQVVISDNGTEVARSTSAEGILINPLPKFERVEIELISETIWTFSDTSKHVVYLVDENGALQVYDTLQGGLNGQEITGLENGQEYCFVIDVNTSFCDAAVLDEYVVNRSHEFCIVPFDSAAPCPPVLSIDRLDCDELDASISLSVNSLSWTGGYEAPDCENDVVKFKLYHQPELQSGFTLLEEFDASTFNYEHFREMNRAGCYYITAVDGLGFESERSNIVCNDNCELIAFPNVITPNGDFRNDVFIPIPEPRNVESIKFEVFNRYGKLVYRSLDNPNIEWGGIGMNGDRLSEGTYYYKATVTFYKLNAQEKEQVFNGWVLISR